MNNDNEDRTATAGDEVDTAASAPDTTDSAAEKTDEQVSAPAEVAEQVPGAAEVDVAGAVEAGAAAALSAGAEVRYRVCLAVGQPASVRRCSRASRPARAGSSRAGWFTQPGTWCRAPFLRCSRRTRRRERRPAPAVLVLPGVDSGGSALR